MSNYLESQEHNVAERLLLRDLLLAGERLHKGDFIRITGNPFSALAQRVYDLKQEGYQIIATRVKKTTGKGYYCYYSLCPLFAKRVAEYGLEIALRGEMMADEVEVGSD